MVAELRKTANRLILYSDNASLYGYINNWVRPLKKVPYIQNGKIVAYDFYYRSGNESMIRQVINGQLFLDLF